MTITKLFYCPNCNQNLEVEEEMFGEIINCPSCNHLLLLSVGHPEFDCLCNKCGKEWHYTLSDMQYHTYFSPILGEYHSDEAMIANQIEELSHNIISNCPCCNSINFESSPNQAMIAMIDFYTRKAKIDNKANKSLWKRNISACSWIVIVTIFLCVLTYMTEI